MIPGYDVYYRPSTLETKRRYLRNLKRAAEMAEKAGVILGLETMENEFMNTVEKAMKYVTLCGSNYLKVYPDIGNLTNAAVQYQSDVLEDLELGRGNITSMHLKAFAAYKTMNILVNKHAIPADIAKKLGL